MGGFTYVSLIILVAILGLVAAATLKTGAVMQRAEAEQQLLDIGAQFSDALQSYASATPPGQPAQPPSLRELLRDPRFPGVRRHLRKLFVDPMTGTTQWGVVYLAGETGVIGVYSRSEDKPIKIGNFPARYKAFDGKAHLSDWRFTMTGTSVTTAPAGAPQPGQVTAPVTTPAGAQNPLPAPPSPPDAAAPAAAPEAPPAPEPDQH
ncbi:type II secretion system protein [Rugamonas sp.]|uniref:type II secretion system protein n=1 Tax=Rugamonas sp. TaxID=1926287 RepID=UPI0025E6073F|nr:type II secretion system protein [Rugamonas sp.]